MVEEIAVLPGLEVLHCSALHECRRLFPVQKLDIAAGGRCTMLHVSFRLVLVVDNCLRDYVSYSQLSWHAREATHSLWDLAASKCLTESGVLPGIQESK